MRIHLTLASLRSSSVLSFLACLSLTLLADPARAQDPGWPREKTMQGARVVYYQPQVDDWQGFSQLDLRMAITITPAGGKLQPGIVTARMHTTVDVDSHTVYLNAPQITGTYFPSLAPEASAKLDHLVREFLPPTASITVSLDRWSPAPKNRRRRPLRR